MIHQRITQWTGKAPIQQLCRVLQVSRSGCYAARQHARTAPVICIDSIHARAAFEASGASYGSRRLSAALRQQGIAIGRHRYRGR